MQAIVYNGICITNIVYELPRHLTVRVGTRNYKQ